MTGYEIKQGKYVSCRAPGQERFTRLKTLGVDYTEEALRERISRTRTHTVKAPKPQRSGINLLIYIQNCIKAQESKGYEHWSKIYNLKQAAKTLNFLTENNLTTYEDLETAANKIHSDFDNTTQKIKAVEKTIGENAMLIKQLEIYRQYRSIYLKLQKVKNKESFTQKFQRELILYEAAERNLKGKNPPPLETLIKDNGDLLERKAKLYKEYKKLKTKSAEIEVIRSNVDTLLNRPRERNNEIEK